VRPAVDIAQLYKERWEIELLFKWQTEPQDPPLSGPQ
jgi:IS4 transposase